MKKNRLICLLLAVFMLMQMIPLAYAAEETDVNNEEDPAVRRGCRTLDAQAPFYGTEKMLDSAEAAFLFETNSDTVMYAWNPDQRIAPASLIKIITCMIVLRECELDEKVTVTESAMSTIKQSAATIKLVPGEVFTVEQLLYALMVGSANDAAVVLAEHVAGSQDSFVAMMNEMASELGCTNTYIVNSHGLHDERQYTTARDVAKMVDVAMQDEVFMLFFGETVYKLPATEFSDERRVETTNYLTTIGTDLYYDSRVTGGRTGITNDGKRSLVATAESGGMTYIVVILSASPTVGTTTADIKWFGSYEEAKELLDMGFKDHKIFHVLYEGQILTHFSVTNGKNDVSVGPATAAKALLPSDVKMEDLVIRYGIDNGSLYAPVYAGAKVSALEVWYGSVCVTSAPVVTLNGSEVNYGSGLQPNRYGGSSKGWVVVLIVLIIAAAVAAVAYHFRHTIQRLLNLKDTMRYRRRRTERRRAR